MPRGRLEAQNVRFPTFWTPRGGPGDPGRHREAPGGPGKPQEGTGGPGEACKHKTYDFKRVYRYPGLDSVSRNQNMILYRCNHCIVV